MKLLQILVIMYITEDLQVCCITCLIRKQVQEQKKIWMKTLLQIKQTSNLKIERRKVYAWFKDNIWAADLAGRVPLSSFYCVVNYLLGVVDVFTKYTWVKSLKDKKLKQFFTVLLKGGMNRTCKLNKLCVGQEK